MRQEKEIQSPVTRPSLDLPFSSCGSDFLVKHFYIPSSALLLHSLLSFPHPLSLSLTLRLIFSPDCERDARSAACVAREEADV